MQSAENFVGGSERLLGAISGIRKASGAPSVSFGILHHGQVLFTHSEGMADIEHNRAPDNQTIYLVGSLTKAFTSALCGILVDEGLLSWVDPVSKYLPEFKPLNDPEIGNRATLLDLCSHGTGLAPVDCAGLGFFDEFLNPGTMDIQTVAHLPVAYDFRSQWLYNNYVNGLVGTIISKVCNKRFGLVLHERILKPLGMERTFTRNSEYADDDNQARGYAVMDNGQCLLQDPPSLEDETLFGASGCVRSTAKDMLIWANAVMEAEEMEAPETQPSTGPIGSRNPLRQIRSARCAHRPFITGRTGYENSYGLGWFRHMLPSEYLASISPNFSLLSDPPVLNKDGSPRLTIAHWGHFGGFLAALYTFPTTRSAVIVMANCNGAKGDPTDFIAQALVQELFAMTPQINFTEYAVQASNNARLVWDKLVEDWVRNRVQNTCCPPLDEFTGTYVNTGLNITIRLSSLANDQNFHPPLASPELLSMTINGYPRQTAKLRHYHYDTWTFLPNSRDDATKKGMNAFLKLSRLLLVFSRSEDRKVNRLEWDLQGGSCDGPAQDLARHVAPIAFTKVPALEG